ncbi:hypothetical protein [Cellulosimicrobium sp. Marseille-Q4280]|uniref:deoxynucleotide monophosphate kinase family protein n=1 Tax=Cellulosimicrobium sp. Marseille-Q4280 TaxID=2937992 RepID=UPI00203D49B4|nr:hypothetical protein [Cellulosimicrobium sp. Marseille-Q4280]
MSAPTWTPETADAMVDAARRAYHGGAPVDLEVTCLDGSRFTRTYAPAYGTYTDSPRVPAAAHLLAMSTLIVGVSGKKRAGKDSIAELLTSEHGYTRVAFADAVREVLYETNPMLWSLRWAWRTLRGNPMRVAELVDTLGWEQAKAQPEVRRLLQRLATEAARKVLGPSIWVTTGMAKAAEVDGPVVITDVRFPNEVAAIRAAGGILIRVNRPSIVSTDTHESEVALDGYDGFDAVLTNDSTVADLQGAALEAIATVTAVSR